MNDGARIVSAWLLVLAGLGVLAGVFLWGAPKYRIYSQTLRGEAALRESEWSKKVLIEQANAEKQSEILRAEGVAEANRIIGESLAGNDEYLRYLWITTLSSDSSKVIYVPTEANLPILEAGRLGSSK